MKVIIFGGFGFIGKNLYEFFKDKLNVVLIDKYIDEEFLKINTNVKYYKYDFSDLNLLKKILNKENPDYIINLISYVTAERKLGLFPKMIESNLNIFLKIYEASKELKNLKITLQFGSGEEYGNIQAPFKEVDKESSNRKVNFFINTSAKIDETSHLLLHYIPFYFGCQYGKKYIFMGYESKKVDEINRF